MPPNSFMRLPALLLGLAGPLLAGAQTPAAPAGGGLGHDSVLSRYQSFKEPPLASWPEANEQVRRIGGWRTYGLEKDRAAPLTPPTPPATADSPANPPAAAPSAGHGSHHGKP